MNAKPDDFELRLKLSLAYERNNGIANALKGVRRGDQPSTATDPKGTRTRLGSCTSSRRSLPAKSAQQQYVAEALAGFDKAIEVGPDYADTYYFRVVLYYAARCRTTR